METLTPTQENDWNIILGTLITLSSNLEYLTLARMHYQERGAVYAHNKVKDAEKACNTAYNAIWHSASSKLSPEEKEMIVAHIDGFKDTMYGFFLMDEQDQKRIKGLMDKIRKEKLQ